MQAIQTTFKGPTNNNGSRIIAKCAAGRIVMGYDHALNIEDNHKCAAVLLISKLGWTGKQYGDLKSGVLPNGDYCHVLIGE